MLEFITILLFGWLFVKVLGLVFRMAWGGTKLIVVDPVHTTTDRPEHTLPQLQIVSGIQID